MLVLVVEDNLLVLTLYEDFITDLGHDVTLAVDGQAALDRLRAGPFDVLVTDLDMPRMNGYQLLHAVGREFPTLICIIASGVEFETALPRLAGSGARVVRHLVKPFAFDVLGRLLADAERNLAA